MLRYLLDTNTCIAIIKRHKETAEQFLSKQVAEVAISTITTFELWTGVQKSARAEQEKRRVDGLLRLIRVLDFDHAAAREAARVRADLESQGQKIGPFDTLIAGHALTTTLTLVTNNIREFRRIPGLMIEDWMR